METYIILTIILLTAIWNGLVIKWGLAKDKATVVKESKLWHGIGFLIRGLLVLLAYLTTHNFWITFAVAFICWLPYNMIINKLNDWDWFHIGTTSTIDKLIRKIFKIK